MSVLILTIVLLLCVVVSFAVGYVIGQVKGFENSYRMHNVIGQELFNIHRTMFDIKEFLVEKKNQDENK